MPKRQTDTKLWSNQRWYKKLHPYHKLVWKYLTDCCDHAGIWKIDYGQLVDDTGIEDFDLAGFVEACNADFEKTTGRKIFRERIMTVGNDVLWLTGFIKFQYENKEFQVNPEVPVVRSALEILNGYGILQEALDKGYITLSKPFGKTPRRPPEPQTNSGAPKNGAIAPTQVDITPENLAANPLDGLQTPSSTLSEPLTKGIGRGSEGLKNKEQRTPPESKEEVGTSYEEEGNPENGKRAKVVSLSERDVGLSWDAEKYVTDHQAEYEAICMKLRKTDEVAKESLRKYHLHLGEYERYPMTGSAILFGFEKWLMKEKFFANGTKSKSVAHGKSAGTDQLIESLRADLTAGGESNFTG